MLKTKRTRSAVVRGLVGGGIGAAILSAAALFAGAGAAARQAKPMNTVPPTIAGTAQEGKTLTGDRGDWDNNPTDFDYRWQRCDQNGGSCSVISGATSRQYTLKSVDVGDTIRFRVIAENSDGSTTATSVPTSVVAKAETPPPAPKPPDKGTCTSKSGTVGVNDIAPPIRLLVDRWSFSPNVVTPGTQTVVARIHVADTCGHSVSGAQVWGTAIPYNQVSVEQSTTDGSGNATLTFRVQSGFPANPGKQQIMAMLIRASDSTENPLAGKSTRRALNLPVNT
jgi:hypothetical protein